MKTHTISAILFFGLLSMVSTNVLAQIPKTINFQGILTKPDGTLVADGSYSLTVQLYETATGGSAIFTEPQSSVPVIRGIFNFIVGGSTALPPSLAFDRAYFLGVSINGGAELSPRTTLTAAPYAFHAAVADFANAVDSSSAVTGINTQKGNIKLQGGNNGSILVTNNGNTIFISAADTTHYATVIGYKPGNLMSVINGSTNHLATAIYGELSNSTIGTDTNAAAVRGAHKGTNNVGVGVYGSHAGRGIGVLGQSAKHGTGVLGLASVDSGIGVQGLGAGNSGIGVDGEGSIGVAGFGSGTGVAGSGGNIGVQGSGYFIGVQGSGYIGVKGTGSVQGGPGVQGIGGTSGGPGVLATGSGAIPGSKDIALQVDNGYIKVSGNTPSAYVHTTTVANDSGEATFLNYPKMDPSDIVIITHADNSFISNYGYSVAWYPVRSCWEISTLYYNMPEGVKFNVLIIKTE